MADDMSLQVKVGINSTGAETVKAAAAEIDSLAEKVDAATPAIKKATTSLRGMRMAMMGANEVIPGFGRALYGLAGVGGGLGVIIAAEAGIRELIKALKESAEAAKKLNDEFARPDFIAVIHAHADAVSTVIARHDELNAKMATSITTEQRYQEEIKRSDAAINARTKAMEQIQKANESAAESEREYENALYHQLGPGHGVDDKSVAFEKSQEALRKAGTDAAVEEKENDRKEKEAHREVLHQEQRLREARVNTEKTGTVAATEFENREVLKQDVARYRENQDKLDKEAREAQSGAEQARKDNAAFSSRMYSDYDRQTYFKDKIDKNAQTIADADAASARAQTNRDAYTKGESKLHSFDRTQFDATRAQQEEMESEKALEAARSREAIINAQTTERQPAIDAELKAARSKAQTDYQKSVVNRQAGEGGLSGAQIIEGMNLEHGKMIGLIEKMTQNQKEVVAAFEDSVTSQGADIHHVRDLVSIISGIKTSIEQKDKALYELLSLLGGRQNENTGFH